MDKKQKNEITQLRKNGLGYKRIAAILKLSVSTVKSYCRRENIQKETTDAKDGCKLCGATLTHTVGKKKKIFCEDKCRMRWWNDRLYQVNKQAYTTHQCKTCNQAFQSYGNTKRKYCSRQCYILQRFGGTHE